MLEYTKKTFDYTIITICIFAVVSVFTEKLSFVSWFLSGIPGLEDENLAVLFLLLSAIPSIYPISRLLFGWSIAISGIGIFGLYVFPAEIKYIYSDFANIYQESIVLLLVINAIFGAALGWIFADFKGKKREVKKILCGKCGQYLGNEEKHKSRCGRCGYNRVKKGGVDKTVDVTSMSANFGWNIDGDEGTKNKTTSYRSKNINKKKSSTVAKPSSKNIEKYEDD